MVSTQAGGFVKGLVFNIKHLGEWVHTGSIWNLEGCRLFTSMLLKTVFGAFATFSVLLALWGCLQV